MGRTLASGWFLCYLLWAGGTHGSEPAFPYRVEVAGDEVEVRSGPGWHYYVTQRLPRGSRVEVYRHDPGGWLAIRPPRESFSWVAARHVRLTDDPHVAEIVQDATVAWIGATQGTVPQHKWQVRLDRGELVEVLGEQTLAIGPGFATEKYCKVAPPAGEFRWIHQRQINGAAAVPVRTPPTVQPVAGTAQTDHPQPPPTATAAAATRSATSGDVVQQLASLRVDLSLLVTQPIERWDLQTLDRRAAELAQAAQGTSAEQEVQAVLARIAEFETLRRRHETAQHGSVPTLDDDIAVHGVSVAPQPTEASSTPGAIVPVGTGVGTTNEDIAPDGSLPEAAGWLMPVHSTRRSAPPFALLDDDGRVAAYVTPSPGLNLRRYVKQRVAVVGQQRYETELRAALITAERVVKRR